MKEDLMHGIVALGILVVGGIGFITYMTYKKDKLDDLLAQNEQIEKLKKQLTQELGLTSSIGK